MIANESFCYVTTVGRVTGNPHEIEIWFSVDDRGAPAIYMMAGGRDRADWVRNLRKTPQVTVRIGKETYPGRARAIDAAVEPDLDARVRRLVADKYEEWESGRELSGWARTALPVAITFDP